MEKKPIINLYKRITLPFTLALTFLSSFAQEKKVNLESTITEIAFKNPYSFNIDIEEKLQNDTNPWKHQTALFSYQKKGEYKKTLELLDLESDKRIRALTDQQIDSITSNYTAIDAKSFIIEQAKNKQVVIINEAHHNPNHRIFTRSLLKELYASGYTYLGLEALYNGPVGGTPIGNSGNYIKDEKDSLLNLRRYPTFHSGNYLEPQMGNLIRTALEIGFIVFSYEKTGVGSGNPRELGQAKNIQHLLEKDPNVKILIHCGYSHAYEGVDVYSPGGKSMAGWLKELTGIDPYTVNQSTYSEMFSTKELNHSLLNAFSFTESKVLMDKEARPMNFIEGNMYTDVAIINPVTSYSHGRPSWIFAGGFEDVIIDLSIFDITFPILLLAYHVNEDISTAIPMDLIEITDEQLEAHLALPSGRYTIIAVNKIGTAKKVDISIK